MTHAGAQPDPDLNRIDLPYGTVIRDTYTVDCHLGRGQFADVYLVRHRYMGMQAMKVFKNTEKKKDDYTAGFNEAFLLSRITHPGIVRVFDANRMSETRGKNVYLTMEYVEGSTLTELLDDEYLTVAEALDLAIQTTDAVAFAHQQDPPIVHRDIKPQNILLEEGEGSRCVRVADFGLAKRVNRITETVAAGGTLLYMSPESLVGYETPASDVYSLGLVVHQMLCDCLPYRLGELPKDAKASEITKMLDKWQREPFRPPSYFKSEISPDIDAVVLRALAHDPKDRFADAGEMRDALTLCQEGLNADTAGNGAGSGSSGVDGETAKRAKQALTLAFQVAAKPGREGEAREWLLKAVHIDPRLQSRYGVYLEVWSTK